MSVIFLYKKIKDDDLSSFVFLGFFYFILHWISGDADYICLCACVKYFTGYVIFNLVKKEEKKEKRKLPFLPHISAVMLCKVVFTGC